MPWSYTADYRQLARGPRNTFINKNMWDMKRVYRFLMFFRIKPASYRRLARQPWLQMTRKTTAATDDSQDSCKHVSWLHCEKKLRCVRITYTHFAIRTIFSLNIFSWENPVDFVILPLLVWNGSKRKAGYKRFTDTSVRQKKPARCDMCVQIISYFYTASWDIFLVPPLSNHLAVEAVIMHKMKGFPRATRNKIIVRENNRIAKCL